MEAGGVKPTQPQGGFRMKHHANAPLGPKGRAIMVRHVVEEGWSLTEAAEADLLPSPVDTSGRLFL